MSLIECDENLIDRVLTAATNVLGSWEGGCSNRLTRPHS